MNERDMRIRLVVRRDGLPEERLMWNVPLENDPTISKLLEKVNETIPLEIGQTGLENYVVELQDEDGTNFECLHFQPIRTVLKPDDRVFIRALDRDDNRRRRLSGRHQISSDGRRLIDGIPFGRPLLRPPIGRPPVEPPRKRARLAYNSETTDDDVNEDEDTPMLLLTNGEESEDEDESSTVKISAEFDDADVEDGDLDGEVGVDELSSSDSDQDVDEDDSESDDQESPEFSDEEDLDQELQDLKADNARVSGATDFDKNAALQAAFPSAPIHICEMVLTNSNDDLKVAYDTLADAFEPKLSASVVLNRSRVESEASKKAAGKNDTSSKHIANDAEDDGMEDDEDTSESEDEDEDQVPDFIRQFDRRGLPPGSITSGKGLAQMAAISGSFSNNKTNGENGSTSATLSGNKTSPDKTTAEDDDTSSAATTSSSEDEDDSDSDSDSSSEDSNDDDDNEDSDDDLRNKNDATNDSEDDSSSDGRGDDNDEDSDSGPEETSTRPSTVGTSRHVDKESLDHSNALGQDESNSKAASDSKVSSSDESSDDESSEAEQDPEPESRDAEGKPSKDMMKSSSGNPTKDVQQIQLPQVPLDITSQTKLVPPGAGKERTKKRNARRKAAKLAKKLAQETAATDPAATAKNEQSSTSVLDEKALFEAKRQELLNAIANGGVEVGPSSRLDNSLGIPTATKRKREDDEADKQNAQEDTPSQAPASEDVQPSSSDQKRPRMDVDAGRRLLFGALGLRNPKTKEDEEKLRAKLMENVRPLENPRLVEVYDGTREIDENSGGPAEDLDSWKDKITYRAVECCHQGVELSEPPFPFVQRWDPQQQGSWFEKKNKRGGRNKRSRRNEAHFYEDNRSTKKRKHDESELYDDIGYDDTFNGIEDSTRDADIELNYDDPKDGQYHETNEPTNDASQFTDMDDLPSLPSDPTTLPVLHPGEVKIGMVITWQQWSCSSATKWQPQLSNVTGVVTRVDDDATGLEVCLAKRDRYLDRNEKKYDTSTGQRIYDRFEAPDIDEDEDEEEDEDEGFRTIGFAEMQQPRIVQQPLPTLITNAEQSEYTNLFSEIDESTEAGLLPTVEDTNAEADVSLERSGLEEPTKDNASADTNSEIPQSGQGQQAGDTSMSDISQISSPSRQLHESTSQAINAKSQEKSAPGICNSEHAGSDGLSEKTRPDGLGSSFPSARLSSAPLHDSEIVTGTPKVVKSTKVTAPSPSASSARSGRQPDYAMDMDIAEPDSLKITDDGTSAPPDLEDQGGLRSDHDKSTPTPKPVRQGETAAYQRENTPRNAQRSSPVNPSTPSSLSSINTVWCTAMTSRNTQSTQSPSKALSLSQSQSLSQSLTAKASQKARAQKDKDFDERMRKLDATYDDQESVSRIPDSFRLSSQQDRRSADISASDIKASSPAPFIKPSPSIRKRKSDPKTSSSQFSIPPGTQVIELSSDSEPAYTEDYADEDVDGTYSPAPDSFPRSNGWVHKKTKAGTGTRNANTRSVTAPIRPQAPKGKKPLSSSQSRHSLSSSSAIYAPVISRRKTSSKF